jgi:CheY-like chemotaxis protein/mono/diheme cytochrome c family protein
LRPGLLAAVLLAAAPAAAFDGTAARGMKDWKLYCAACHGGDGRGRRQLETVQEFAPGTLDITGRGLEDWPDEALKATIDRMVEKRPGLKEAHALSTGTVEGLISYLRIVARGDAVALSSSAWADVKDPGERAYLKACAPCHGRSGAGIFDTGWSVPTESSMVDLRPPLPKRKVRKAAKIKSEWIAFEGGLSREELDGLVPYVDKLEVAERARTLDGSNRHGYIKERSGRIGGRMGKTILIADDEPDMADFLKTALEAEGYVVESAASADAITNKLKTLTPDLILLDMGMPGLNPVTPAQAVRDKTKTKAKILIMTGRDIAKEQKEGHLKGSDGALQKGAGMDSIITKVKEVAGK